MKQFGNNLLRKCLAVFFAALMVFSILPMSALAEAFDSLADEGTAEIGNLSKDNISKLESRSATKAVTTYEKIDATSVDDITMGNYYLITYTSGTSAYALSGTSSTASSYTSYLADVKLTVDSNGTITSGVTDDMLWRFGQSSSGDLLLLNKAGNYLTYTSTSYYTAVSSTGGAPITYTDSKIKLASGSRGLYFYTTNLYVAWSSSSADTLTLYEETATDTSVSAVELDTPVHAMAVGATKQLTAYVMPVGEATNTAVTWTSDNTSVATVSSSGLVTAKANGTATITVTTADGGYTDTCVVTVTSNSTKEITYYERTFYAYPGAEYLIGASDSSSNFYLMSGTASGSYLAGTQTALTTVGDILGTSDTTAAVAGSSDITDTYTWTVGADIAHGQYYDTIINKATSYYLTHGTTSSATEDGSYVSLSTGTTTSSSTTGWGYATLNSGNTATYYADSSVYYSISLSSGTFGTVAYSSATVANSQFYRKYTVTVEDTAATTYRYVLADTIIAGEQYIIVAGGQGAAVSNNIVSSNHYLAPVTVTENSDDTLTVAGSVNVNEILWTAGGNSTSGWTFKSVDDGKYMGLDSSEYLAPSSTAVAWTYDGTDLNNQIDSAGYYYLSYDSDNTRFTTSQSTGNNIVFYQKVDAATPTPTVAPTPTPTAAPTPTPTVPPVEEDVYYEPVSTVETGVEYLIGYKTTDGKVYLLMNYNPNPVSNNYYVSVSSNFYGYGIEATLDGDNVVGVSNSAYADANIKNVEWFFVDQGSTYYIQSAYNSSYYLHAYSTTSYVDCYPRTVSTTVTEWEWNNSQLTSSAGKYVTFVPTVGSYSNLFSAPASATEYSTIQLYAKRTVTTTEPTLVLDKTAIALSMQGNTTADITATVENLPEGATPIYTWEVKDDTVASVTGNGSVANITALQNGSTLLTCTVTFGDTTLTANAEINIADLKLVSISLDPQSVILSMDEPDKTAEVTATVTTDPAGGVIGTDYDLVWTSSSPNFATVTPIDGTNKATITPVAAGSTTITCVAVNKYDQTQTVRYTCNVVVKTAGQIPAPETGVGEEGTHVKVFVLVDDFEDGGRYIIAEGMTAGTTYALRDTGATYIQRKSLTVKSGTGYGDFGRYIEAPDESYVWRYKYVETSSTYGLRGVIWNEGTGNGTTQGSSSPYAMMPNDGSSNYLYSSPNTSTTDPYHYILDSNNYYLYNYSSTYPYAFYSKSYSTKFYYYKETVVQSDTTTAESGVDIYCDGTRISQQEYKVQASSQTTKTLEATPLNVPSSATGISTTWSIYSQSSPEIASVDSSTGVVTFTGETGYAVVKVTYEYTYGGTTYTVTNYTKLVVETPEPESADDTVTTTTKIFQLVDDFEDGGNYIIVYNKNAAATDAQVLYPQSTEYTGTYSGSSGDVDYKEHLVGVTSGIVINAADSISSVPYIVTDNYNMVWNYEALSSGGKISNVGLGGYNMCYDIDIDSSYKLLTANDRLYLTMYYDTSDHYLYYTSSSTNYNIGMQDDTTYALGFSSSNGYPFYLYKEVEVTSTTTGKVGIDIYNGATCVSGTTVDVSGTSIQLSQQNNLSSSVTDETVTWEIVDSKIATVDQNGLVTITDTTGGEALVKVTLTWTGSDGTTKTATNYVTIRVASGDVIVDTGDTENFPEYPNEGSIRIEKNAYTAEGTDYYNTGVGTVELFARGVPMNSKPVDVVLVIDVSGSMEYDINGEETSVAADQKMTLAKTAAKTFVEKLLKTAAGYSDNRVAIVTFSEGAEIITGTNTLVPTHNALIQVGNDDQLDSLNGVIDGITAIGGTDYDAALQYAYEILNSACSQPGYSREQFVVFLTDGAPGVYNQMELGRAAFPKDSSEDYYTTTQISTMSSLWYKWTTGVAPTTSDWSYMTTDVASAFAKYKFTDHHYAAAIKAESFSALNMDSTVRSELGITSTLGATIYGISLGMSAGSQIASFSTGSSTTTWTEFTAAQCTDLINRIVGSSDRVFAADDTDQLNEAFESIGSAILLAGTNAVVTDVIHPNFELQTADYGNITEYPDYTASEDSKSASIEVRKYTVDTNGNRTGEYETLERVTFSTDGTAAYSNVLGTSNILSKKDDGSYTITASLFTYESATKTFTWRIGDITANDMAIRYNVYLTDTRNTADGAGARTGGRYDTNAQAYITYENHMGNRCKKVYEVPALPWASAIVTYRFYLVNDDGQPVNSSGQLVDYQNLTYVTDEKKVDMTRIVNTTTGGFNYDYTLYAAALKAGISRLNGFDLYDPDAAYHVESNGKGGGEGTGKYIVSGGEVKVNTTVVRNAPDATPYATPVGESSTAGDYTNTVVEFAVIWRTKVIPDAVVIDYGLPVSIPVVNNDLVSSVSATLYGIYAGKADAANAAEYYTDSVSTATMGGSLRLTYGTASIVDATHIEYTPASMSMNGVEEFSYEVSYKTDTEDRYLTTSIQVIPATTVYYEDNFTGSDGVTFTNGVGGQAQWQVVGSATATVQDTDYVGEGGNYGHDSHYEQGMTYSLSSAHKITVTQEHFDAMIANDKLTWPTASFTFTGTGFDVVSLCNADSGIITVEVTDEKGNYVTSFFVNTYYEGTQVVVDDNMYQIPVINCYDLTYGTYNVVITTPYVPILDSTNAGGDGSYDLYIDGIRIYNPAQGDETATNAYIEDNEGYPIFKEMRDMLLNSVEYDPEGEGSADIEFGGAMFVDGIAATAFASDYADVGPNNEIYLAPGQGIAFALRTTEAKPTGIYFGMKSPNGEAIAAVEGNHTGASIRNTINLNTTSDMYYEIPADALGEWTEDAENNTWTSGYLVITNVSPVDSGRVIALTNLKTAFASEGKYDIVLLSNAPSAVNAHEMIRSGMIDLYGHEYDMDIHAARAANTTVTLGNPIVLTVVTSTDVDELVIMEGRKTEVQPDSISYVDGENGQRTWTVTIATKTTGFKLYDIKGVGDFGITTETAKVVSVIVTKKAPFGQSPILVPFPVSVEK